MNKDSIETPDNFTCDCCGEEKTGERHPMYDENWNLLEDCIECHDCFEERLR